MSTRRSGGHWRPTRLFPNQPRMANYARSMKEGGGGMGVDGGKGGSCPLANLCTTGPARTKRFGWSKGIRNLYRIALPFFDL